MGLQRFGHDWATELNCTELWYLNMPVINQEALWLPPKAPHFEFHDTLPSSLQPFQIFKLVKIQVLSVGSADLRTRTSFQQDTFLFFLPTSGTVIKRHAKRSSGLAQSGFTTRDARILWIKLYFRKSMACYSFRLGVILLNGIDSHWKKDVFGNTRCCLE